MNTSSPYLRAALRSRDALVLTVLMDLIPSFEVALRQIPLTIHCWGVAHIPSLVIFRLCGIGVYGSEVKREDASTLPLWDLSVRCAGFSQHAW